jgi:L-ribulokinase
LTDPAEFPHRVVYKDISASQKAMGGGFEKEYSPDPVSAKKYDLLFKKYKELGAFIESKT